MRKQTTLLLLLLMAIVGKMVAQDIQITRFERNYTSLIGSVRPVYDNTGEACAVIRFFVRDAEFVIEPNLGVLKSETLPGDTPLRASGDETPHGEAQKPDAAERL